MSEKSNLCIIPIKINLPEQISIVFVATNLEHEGQITLSEFEKLHKGIVTKDFADKIEKIATTIASNIDIELNNYFGDNQ